MIFFRILCLKQTLVTIKFSTYGITLPLKEFQVLEHFVSKFMDFVFLNYGFSTRNRRLSDYMTTLRGPL